jgi:hypothetical protein
MQQILNTDFADIYVPVPVYPNAVGTVCHIVGSAQHVPAGKQLSVSVKDADAAAFSDVNGIVCVNV